MSLTRKISVGIFLFLLFVILIAPQVAKFVAIDQLEKLGATKVRLDSVVLNPFQLKVGIKGLEISDEQDKSLAIGELMVNASWLALFQKRIVVESLILSEVEADIEKAENNIWFGLPIDLAGQGDGSETAEPESTEPESSEPFDWGLGLKTLLIEDISVSFTEKDFQQNIKVVKLTVEDVYDWLEDTASQFSIDLQIDDKALAIQGNATPFAATKRASFGLIAEELQLAPYGVFASEQFAELAGGVSMNQQLTVTLEESGVMIVSAKGDVVIEDVALVNKEASLPLKAVKDFGLTWDGLIDLKLSSDFQPYDIAVQGRLSNDVLDVELSEPDITVVHQGIEWQGEVDLSDLDNLAEVIKAKSNLTLNQLLVSDHTGAIVLMRLPSMALTEITVQGLNSLTVESFTAKDIVVASFEAVAKEENESSNFEALLDSLSIAVEQIKVTDLSEIEINLVRLSDLKGAFLIGEDGGTPQIDKLLAVLETQAGQDEEGKGAEEESEHSENLEQSSQSKVAANDPGATAVSEANTDAKPVSLLLNRFEVAGDSQFAFSDVSVNPAFKRIVKFNVLTLEAVEWAPNPRQMSVDIDLAMDDDSTVLLKGTAVPNVEAISTDLKLDIDHLKLVPLSGYITKATGYKVKTGQLTLDADIKITNNQMNIRDKIVLNNIELTPDNKEKLDKLAKELTMPLDYALNIIRDKQGNVVLKVPIKGDVTNPAFSLNDVLKVAMKKALRVATVHYLKNMLAPYGTAISVASFIGNYATKVRLDAVEFKPESTELSEESKKYLTTLSQNVLLDKPALRLKLCGYAGQTELEALNQQLRIAAQTVEKTGGGQAQVEQLSQDLDAQLMALATQRATVVQDYLVQLGVAKERLFECSPEIDAAKKAQPRVELSI